MLMENIIDLFTGADGSSLDHSGARCRRGRGRVATGATNARGRSRPGYASASMARCRSSVVRIVYVRAPVLPLTSWPINVSMRGSAMPPEASLERTVWRSEWKSGRVVPSSSARVLENHCEK